MQEESIATGITPETCPALFLYITLVEDHYKGPWSQDELLEHAAGTFTAAQIEEGLATLKKIGLAHRCGEFAWATRDAVESNVLLR